MQYICEVVFLALLINFVLLIFLYTNIHCSLSVIITLGIGKLQLLEKLNVCNNCLKKLNPAVSQLKSLTSLHLANNELSFLPKGILKGRRY